MTFLRIICLLSILAVSGASHQCKTCHDFGENCRAYDRECPGAEDVCGSVMIDTSIAPFSLRTIHKSCFSPAVCQLGFISLNVGNGVLIRARVNCCPDMECPVLPLPGSPMAMGNGYYCPGCIGFYTHDCTEYASSCTGSETKCIDIVGQRDMNILGHALYNIKGCASSCPSVTVTNATLEKRQNGVSRFTCTDAIKMENLGH